eukprot:TRINITY_DN10984_c0_g1_i1.p1 TRINITY_DN10984_c0_g1~~TRINITY_DN10984_c0_g1_i1.p1  ORF type:complete len:120 (+),score=25.31 TRINITY_DN10984_c0_g1_i1:2-361(+)
MFLHVALLLVLCRGVLIDSSYLIQMFLFFIDFFFFNDTATTEIYTLHIVGSVRCVQETEIKRAFIIVAVAVRITIVVVIITINPVSYTHLRAHETRHDLVCRLLLEKKKKLDSENQQSG